MILDEDKKAIIRWGQILHQKGFVTATGGNISVKVAPRKILITAHNSYMGYLEKEDLVLIDLKGNIIAGEKETTSEKPLHLDIHGTFDDVKVILHAHPPYTVAFFHYFDSLNIIPFEAKFYLADIKIIPQATATVSDTKPVTEALHDCRIAVLKDHGVVSIGRDFKEAFSLIELLEQQAKVNLITRQ